MKTPSTPRRGARRTGWLAPVWLAALGFVALALWVAPAGAQTPAGSDAARIEQLEKEVAALRAALAEIKARGAATEAAPAAPAPADDRLAEVERRLDLLAGEIEKLAIGEAAAEADRSDQGMGPAASKVYRTERGVSIGGYGEAFYERPDDRADDGSPSGEEPVTVLERAVVYFGYKWNDRLLFNSEVEFEEGGEEVSVEFAYLDFLMRREANLRAGHLLLPVGFLNELHEPTTFLGSARPQVERRILPSTWHENGFGLFGDIGPWSYRTYVVDGFAAEGFTAEGLRGGRQGGADATAKDLAWVGRVDYTGLPGLLAGGSAYVGRAGQGLAAEPSVRLFEGHVEWKKAGFELRALGVQARVGDAGKLSRELGLAGDEAVGERLTGGYVQAGYDLFALHPRGQQSLVPFARFESFDTQDRVPAGFRKNPANAVEILTVGLNYKPIPQVVVKVDYQDVKNDARTAVDQLNLGLGWVF